MDLPLTAALAAGAALLVLGCAYFALARARAVVRDVFRALGLIRDEARQVDRRLQEAARELEIVKERVSDIRAAMGLTQSAVWADALPEFLTPFDWNGAIAEASLRRPEPILAHAFVRRRATGSQPVDLRCADGSVYVVKGPRLDDPDQSCRIFAEYVVGRLARLIGAPVSDVALISIPPSLIAAHCDPQHGMGHLLPGEAHGSRFGDGLGEHSHEIKHIAANRERFASLAILHAWTQSFDRQFLYESRPPHHVHSTDHGSHFNSGPKWSPWHSGDPRLSALAHVADDITEACGLTREELMEAAAPLHDVTARQVAEILAVPPDSWGVDPGQRAIIGRYLRLRQFHLLALYGPMKQVSHLHQKSNRDPLRARLVATSPVRKV